RDEAALVADLVARRGGRRARWFAAVRFVTREAFVCLAGARVRLDVGKVALAAARGSAEQSAEAGEPSQGLLGIRERSHERGFAMVERSQRATDHDTPDWRLYRPFLKVRGVFEHIYCAHPEAGDRRRFRCYDCVRHDDERSAPFAGGSSG